MKHGLKVLSVLLAVFMLVSIIPTSAVAGGSGVADRLNALRTKFPDGKYWNHYCGSTHNNKGPFDTCTSSTCMNPDSWTNTPCTTHNGVVGKGGYDCNCFDGGIQCFGFANKIFYDVFGVKASQMSWRYDKENVAVGDWIRVDNDGHSAVVLSRSGNNITIVEGNYSKNCMIKWDRTISINTITYFKHATNYDAVNGSSKVTATWSTYADKHWIGETNAVLAKRVDLTGVSNGDVTKIGIELYDSNEKLLASFRENPNVTYGTQTYILMWYDVNLSTELNYTLTHATTYKYKMFAVVKGETYYSPLESFTTKGEHSYGEWKTIKAASCTQEGSKERVCACGDTITEAIPANGHSWGPEVVVTEATCVSLGKKTKTCTVCGKTETITVNDLHAKHAGEIELRNKKSATCGADGYTGDTYCNACGKLIDSGSLIEKTGNHTWDEGVVTTPATETSDGVKTYACTVCGETKTEPIPHQTQPEQPEQPTDAKAGDINGDGEVNNKDLTRLMKYLAGAEVETVSLALDVNGDGEVNNKDLTRLMKYLAGTDIQIFYNGKAAA